MEIEHHQAHNLEAEQAFLACLLLDDQLLKEIFPALSDEDFYLVSHRHLYRIIRMLADSDQPADQAGVVAELTLAGIPEIDDAARYVERIARSVPHAGNGRFYAEIIRAKRIERELVECHERARRVEHKDGTTEV